MASPLLPPPPGGWSSDDSQDDDRPRLGILPPPPGGWLSAQRALEERRREQEEQFGPPVTEEEIERFYEQPTPSRAPRVAQLVAQTGENVGRSVMGAGEAVLNRMATNAEENAASEPLSIRSARDLQEVLRAKAAGLLGPVLREGERMAGELSQPKPEEMAGQVAPEGFLENVLAAATQMGLTASLAPLGGTAVMAGAGAQEMGAAWNRAKGEGANDDQAFAAAAATGVVNAALERTGLEKVIGGLAKGAGREVVDRIRQIGTAMVAEGGTEAAQEFVGEMIALGSYAGDRGLSWRDIKEGFSEENLRQYGLAGAVGSVVGGGVNAAGQALQIAEQSRNPPSEERPEYPVQPEEGSADPVEGALAEMQDSLARLQQQIRAERTQVSAAQRPDFAPISPQSPSFEVAVADQPEIRQENPPAGPSFGATRSQATPPAEGGVSLDTGRPRENFEREAPRLGEDPDPMSRSFEYSVPSPWLPELVDITKSVIGRAPQVGDLPEGVRGLMIGSGDGKIVLDRKLFENPDLAARTLAHEFGHIADYYDEGTLARGNVLGRIASAKKPFMEDFLKDPDGGEFRLEQLQEEMTAVSAEMRGAVTDKSSPEYVEYRKKPDELYADAFAAQVFYPEMVEAKAPTFARAFRAYLDEKPSIAAAYYTIRERAEMSRADRMQGVQERYLSMVRASQAKMATEAAERGESVGQVDFKSLKAEVVDAVIDRKRVLREMTRAARKKGIAVDSDRNAELLGDEVEYMLGRNALYLHEIATQVQGPLDHAEIPRDVWSAWLTLRRAAGERGQMANPQGAQGTVAEELMARIENELGPEKRDLLFEAADRFWEARQPVIRSLVDSGVLSEDLAAKIDSNREYVRFVKRLDEEQEALGNVGAGLGMFKKQQGMLADVEDPFIKTVMADMMLQRWVHREQLKGATIEVLRDIDPDQVIEAKRVRGGRFETMPEKHRELQTVFVMTDGKTSAYHVPKRVAKALQDADPMLTNTRLVMRRVYEPMRQLLTERNPGWPIWNLQRDYWNFTNRVVQTANPLKAQLTAAKYMLKAMPEAARLVWLGDLGPNYKEMLENFATLQPGEISLHFASNHDQMQMFERLLSRFNMFAPDGHGRAKHWQPKSPKPIDLVKWLWWAIGTPAEFTERWVKLAGWNYLKDGRPDLSPRERAAETRRKVGTPDLMRRGNYTWLTNIVWLFSNVQKEDLRTVKQTLEDDPVKYLTKTAAQVAQSKAVLAAAALGLLGEEMEDLVARIPSWERITYTIVPLGLTSDGKAVYFRFPLDHVGQAVAGVTWAALFESDRSGKGGLAQLGEEVLRATPWSTGNLHPAIQAATAWGSFVSGKNPDDAFTNRPIVDEDTEDAFGLQSPEAAGEMLKWTWNELGGRAVFRFDTNSDDLRKKGNLEKALGLPAMGTALRRLVGISDAGLREEAQVDLKKKRKADAVRRNVQNQIMRQALVADPEVKALQVHGLLREAGVPRKRVSDTKRSLERMRARLYGKTSLDRVYTQGQEERDIVDDVKRRRGVR